MHGTVTSSLFVFLLPFPRVLLLLVYKCTGWWLFCTRPGAFPPTVQRSAVNMLSLYTFHLLRSHSNFLNSLCEKIISKRETCCGIAARISTLIFQLYVRTNLSLRIAFPKNFIKCSNFVNNWNKVKPFHFFEFISP